MEPGELKEGDIVVVKFNWTGITQPPDGLMVFFKLEDGDFFKGDRFVVYEMGRVGGTKFFGYLEEGATIRKITELEKFLYGIEG